MTTITYRGVKYDAEAYKEKVIQEQQQVNRFNMMYRGIRVGKKLVSGEPQK
tara:strand:+ start:158 stop:310 length:153 start_codon:yes stop_codon:yes gene_type:complete